ncbi:MAG TPA: hypothetical protein VFW24_05810 [Acidimicrobiales bacterium]|nr:hypothetical protein [Acidimicrobiales bacterium]
MFLDALCPAGKPRELLGQGRLGPTWAVEGPGGERLVVKRLAGLAPAAAEAAEAAALIGAVPGCVAPADTEARDGDLWVVYPFVDGLLPVEAAATLGSGVCADVRRAVAELHAAGLAHGALSDSNVRVTAGGEVHLLDAGLAGLGTRGAVGVASVEGDRRDLSTLLRQMEEAAPRDGGGAKASKNGHRHPRRRMTFRVNGRLGWTAGVLALVPVVAAVMVPGVLGTARPAARSPAIVASRTGQPAPWPLTRCATVSLPDAAGATYYAVDMSGTGCAEPMVWRAGVISTVSPQGVPVRFSLGRPGDVLLVGHWTCARRELPALYRPGTGEVFYLSAWPSGERPVTSAPAVETGVRDGTARTAAVNGCERVVVVR